MRKYTLWVLALSLAALAAFAAAPPNLTKAIETQRRLTVERPGDPGVFNDLGNLLVMANRTDEAIAAFERAVEIDPQKAAAHFNLGMALQQRGDLKQAMRHYRDVLAAEPRHAWSHFQIGTIYEAWGQDSKAVESYATAFRIDPQLTFSEVNPAVIDSALMTEAVLTAYREEKSAPYAPPYFDEPGRIAALLVPPVAQPAPTEDAPAVAEAPEAGRPNAGGNAAGREGRPNVLREGNLDRSGAVNQASPQGGSPRNRGQIGGRSSSTSSRQVPRTFSRPGDPTAGQGMQAQPGEVVPPPGRVIYRPGLPSTGRLEIQVVPEQEGRGAA